QPPPAVEGRIKPTLVTPKLVSVPLLVVSVVPAEQPTVSTPVTAFRTPAPVAVIDALRSFASASVMFAPEAVTAPTKSFVSRPRLRLQDDTSELQSHFVIVSRCALPPPAVEVRLEPTLVTPKLVSVPQLVV